MFPSVHHAVGAIALSAAAAALAAMPAVARVQPRKLRLVASARRSSDAGLFGPDRPPCLPQPMAAGPAAPPAKRQRAALRRTTTTSRSDW